MARRSSPATMAGSRTLIASRWLNTGVERSVALPRGLLEAEPRLRAGRSAAPLATLSRPLTVEPRLSAVGPSLAALHAAHVSCLSSCNELPGICYFSSVVALGKGQEKQELLRLIGTLGRKSGDMASF